MQSFKNVHSYFHSLGKYPLSGFSKEKHSAAAQTPQKPDSYPATLWRCSRLQETKHRTMCGYHNKKHVSKEKGNESEARTCGHTELVLRRGAELQLTFTGMLIETHSLRFKMVIYSA